MARAKAKAADAQRAQELPNTRTMTIIAQDPSIKVGGRILTTEVEIPAEELAAGPCGYRVNVVDYDASTDTLYTPARYPPSKNGHLEDVLAPKSGISAKAHNDHLLNNPHFHAQNVYAIVMKTLARFEFALGRRVAWGSDGHQLHIAPHAFNMANAFYSKEDRGLYFGYFNDSEGRSVHTCLSHDVVAHETTHALLDGLRSRFIEPSSPDQAAFHEGFSDIVALLSIFAQRDVVEALLAPKSHAGHGLIDRKYLTPAAMRKSVLLGLAEQMGEAITGVRGKALRHSVELKPGLEYMSMPEFEEPHRRGEVLVAAMLNAFIAIWDSRLSEVGYLRRRMKSLKMVVQEGARVADHLLTMAIRALDYCPTTDINFCDYLSALLTIDREVVRDDTKFDYRGRLMASFADYDIHPPKWADKDGAWLRCTSRLVYGRTHFQSMLSDKEEVFRFIWENRKALRIHPDGYVEVETVRPCSRIGPDGFILHETVAEYVQILTLSVDELYPTLRIRPPKDMPGWRRVRLFGGGALIFDEYGQLKYQISNRLDNPARQSARLTHLWEAGYFERPMDGKSAFSHMHLMRATS